MPKPVVLQIKDYPAWDQDALDTAYDMIRLQDGADSLATRGADVRAIATRGDCGVENAVIEACPNLELISIYGVGFDAVDLDLCAARGIAVTNTPDVLTGDVADLAIAMMLAQSRTVLGAEHWVRSGDWAGKGGLPLSRRVFGKRAGILGLGRIGFEVGRRLAGFDMDILYSDIAPKDYAPDWTYVGDPVELARDVDFLFVTLAASAQTRHIVGAEVLDALGPDGMVINVSRAANIDEEALIDALQAGRVGSACLDVFEGEPDLDPRFLTLERVLLQPHHASGTVETRQAMGQLMRDNLAAHFAGQPLITPVQESR